MLSDAEFLLGLGRHLCAYTIGATHAALDSLQFAGQVYETRWRGGCETRRSPQLTGSGRSASRPTSVLDSLTVTCCRLWSSSAGWTAVATSTVS